MKRNKYDIPFDVKSTTDFLKKNPDHPLNKLMKQVSKMKEPSEIERQKLLKKIEEQNEE